MSSTPKLPAMDPQNSPSLSLAQRRASLIDSDNENAMTSRTLPQPIGTNPARLSRRPDSLTQPHPRPLPTPSKQVFHHSLLPSAPASPPTPAPSPTPHQRIPSWKSAGENEDSFLKDVRTNFSLLESEERIRFLGEILNLCDSHQLSFVHSFVSPRLKKDPFRFFPNELCLRVLSFIEDPKSLARASQVSRRWHDLLSDDMTWKVLCEKHAYRWLADESSETHDAFRLGPPSHAVYKFQPASKSPKRAHESLLSGSYNCAPPDLTMSDTSGGGSSPKTKKLRPKTTSYRSHFKQKYQIEAAWRKGGDLVFKHITPDQGVVTSLHLTSKYIVVALDNAKIHVFNTSGEHQKTLEGHVMGVWAMVPWDDILVSGGCDRDVRVWNMATGASLHTLRGHTSTVRCLKMADANTAISGSRDTTLRIWDLPSGVCKNVLVGHQASVRCLCICGDLVVSGSYDTTARIWSISEGRCLKTLTGHFSQIYAIAFDGRRIATGSLDTSVRIWDPQTGACTAVLQGHTSLVGQLQMRGDILVTGGSDGSVRVWSLKANTAIHRLAAHDNSVTSLQFDDTRIVSGGSDGRVKIWSLKSGQLVRELSQPAEAVWRVAFEDEKAVVMASRGNRTVMEVWSFSPPAETEDIGRSSSPMSLPDQPMHDVEHGEKSRVIDVTDTDSIMEDSDTLDGQ